MVKMRLLSWLRAFAPCQRGAQELSPTPHAPAVVAGRARELKSRSRADAVIDPCACDGSPARGRAGRTFPYGSSIDSPGTRAYIARPSTPCPGGGIGRRTSFRY
jgi:hypothetical protein